MTLGSHTTETTLWRLLLVVQNFMAHKFNCHCTSQWQKLFLLSKGQTAICLNHLNLAGTETVNQMLGMLSMLRPLLAGVAATFRRLSLQLLQLHKGVAKLGYIVTSLLSGVMQEGYCTASETEDTEAGESPS